MIEILELVAQFNGEASLIHTNPRLIGVLSLYLKEIRKLENHWY